MAWQLVHPSRVDVHPFIGSLTVKNTVESTVYGDDSELHTLEDGGLIPEGTQYIWRGGCQNITTDPTIRDLWLEHGYSVVEV